MYVLQKHRSVQTNRFLLLQLYVCLALILNIVVWLQTPVSVTAITGGRKQRVLVQTSAALLKNACF